jgi:hypothetical protein
MNNLGIQVQEMNWRSNQDPRINYPLSDDVSMISILDVPVNVV